MSGKLRVLPLGGVGEIGKNLTVVDLYPGEWLLLPALVFVLAAPPLNGTRFSAFG